MYDRSSVYQWREMDTDSKFTMQYQQVLRHTIGPVLEVAVSWNVEVVHEEDDCIKRAPVVTGIEGRPRHRDELCRLDYFRLIRW